MCIKRCLDFGDSQVDFNDILKTIKGSLGSAFRRYFVNTIFDSTFVLLGIIIGSAFSESPNLETVLTTMLISSLALGISTGVSVYEAESLERERRIIELEKHMFVKLKGTNVEQSGKVATAIIALMNFLTPLFSFAVMMPPFILVSLGILDLTLGGWISIALALMEIFVVGVYIGRLGRRNPYLKGLRMLVFGVIAFAIGYALESLI
ncbi:VIT1/CCC1 transporter family protein [Candidatus Bathyarchaeota archaeon]|nr:VIT1/CCC1 transporter family protein [Candidatus Bathyarchaeota archaeon]